MQSTCLLLRSGTRERSSGGIDRDEPPRRINGDQTSGSSISPHPAPITVSTSPGREPRLASDAAAALLPEVDRRADQHAARLPRGGEWYGRRWSPEAGRDRPPARRHPAAPSPSPPPRHARSMDAMHAVEGAQAGERPYVRDLTAVGDPRVDGK